jgi:hypothetical protein
MDTTRKMLIRAKDHVAGRSAAITAVTFKRAGACKAASCHEMVDAGEPDRAGQDSLPSIIPWVDAVRASGGSSRCGGYAKSTGGRLA